MRMTENNVGNSIVEYPGLACSFTIDEKEKDQFEHILLPSHSNYSNFFNR